MPRIAVYDAAAAGWTAGGTIVETVVRALLSACPDKSAIVVLTEGGPGRWQALAPVIALPRIGTRRGEIRVRAALHLPPQRGSAEYVLEKERIDTVLLASLAWCRHAGYRRIPWIPDFQHKHMPEHFSEVEMRKRDRDYRLAAKSSHAVMLMSNTVLADFKQYLPEFADKGKVFHFPSLFAYVDVPSLDDTVAASYGLPRKFILVANQYWSHKNHAVVLAALALLRNKGLTIPVAFTGLPVDYRDHTNAPTSNLLQGIARQGLSGTAIPLGLVPRADMVSLMRCCAAVVQPSLFEGWGLSVQEAIALGRPVICSDIPALRENAPDALGFFDPHNATALAALLERIWPQIEAGPDEAAEAAALARQKEFGIKQGQALLALCRQ